MPESKCSTETEIKIRIPERSLDSLRKKILANGFRRKSSRSLETNTLFDYEDQRIYREGSAVRLRSYGNRTILTWKGPLHPEKNLKIREEIETEVASMQSAIQILERLGLYPALEYSKFRETFEYESNDRVEICLDETSAGSFIEIEGSGDDIAHFAGILGLNIKDQVRASYVELLGRVTVKNGENK